MIIMCFGFETKLKLLSDFLLIKISQLILKYPSYAFQTAQGLRKDLRPSFAHSKLFKISSRKFIIPQKGKKFALFDE